MCSQLTHVKTNIFHVKSVAVQRQMRVMRLLFLQVDKQKKTETFSPQIQEPQLDVATVDQWNAVGYKLNSEQQKMPQTRSALLFPAASELPMNPPQRHICFSVHGNTVVGESGVLWRTLRLLTYAKQMRLEGELLFWEFFLLLGKPQLTG